MVNLLAPPTECSTRVGTWTDPESRSLHPCGRIDALPHHAVNSSPGRALYELSQCPLWCGYGSTKLRKLLLSHLDGGVWPRGVHR